MPGCSCPRGESRPSTALFLARLIFYHHDTSTPPPGLTGWGKGREQEVYRILQSPVGLPKARGTQQRLTLPSIYSQTPRVLRTRGPGGGARLCPQSHCLPDGSPTAYRRHGSEQAPGLAHYIGDFYPATWAGRAGGAEAACTRTQTKTHTHTRSHTPTCTQTAEPGFPESRSR